MPPRIARRGLLAMALAGPALLAAGCVVATRNPREGEVQAFVAQNHPALIADVEAGGGPTLDQAMAISGVNAATRDILMLRLQSELPLYRRSPLATAAVIAAHGAGPDR
ncbi:MAG: hypothetical protein MUF73_16015 [Rhodobacteraceae bacterium]|jgi:hypothetical protein|nr:hypothetical protein [Paracoccaceae bacterium]